MNWLLSISGILMVRFFLESLSSHTSSGYFASDVSTLIHYYLFFLSMAVVFMIFLQKILPSWRHVAPQLIALSFIMIFIAPIADWVISGGKGLTMTYLFDSPREMFVSLLTFFGKNLYVGITWGLRIEIALVVLFIGFFVYFVEKSLKRAVISIVSFYVLIFGFLSLPGIISIISGGNNMVQNYFGQPLFFIQKSIENSATVLNNIHSSLEYSSKVRLFEIAFNFLMGKILFLFLISSTFFWFNLNLKNKLKAIIKNSRPERVTHYLLMIFLGLFIAHSIFPTVKFNWNDWLSIIVLCFSFYFSWMFAVCVNDIVDEGIDAVSNTNRPLIEKTLSKEDMKQSAFIFLIASLISGFLAGYTAFFFVLTFTGLYYIYSAPPVRLKLIPFLSSFIIGICCLTAVLAGFFNIASQTCINFSYKADSSGSCYIFLRFSYSRYERY